MPGTAKRDRMYVVFEWPAGWSRDVLDGDTFGVDLSAQIKAHLGAGVGFQLIRKPGRAGHQMPQRHRAYLVYPEQAYAELLYLDGPEDILQLDLTGPGTISISTLAQAASLWCWSAPMPSGMSVAR